MSLNNIKPSESCPVVFTDEALLRFSEAKASDAEAEAVRIGVKGGGCSGFMHVLEFIKEADIDPEEDSVYKVGEVHFVIDCFSEPYIKGTTIDYMHTLKESGFKFISQDVRRTCGCGSSFSK